MRYVLVECIEEVKEECRDFDCMGNATRYRVTQKTTIERQIPEFPLFNVAPTKRIAKLRPFGC